MRSFKLPILLLLFISMIGNFAYAYDIAVENEDGVTIYYNWINDKTELEVTSIGTSHIKYEGSVSIPETVTYNGQIYKVIRIGSCAFEGCSVLTSLTIPNSVTSIGNNAFYGCI